MGAYIATLVVRTAGITISRSNELGNCLSVTKNCEYALRTLRQKDQERVLWIDAICIDQSNIPERGHQVQLMSKIYAQAIRVLAYLGEASGDSEIGMDFILEDVEAIYGSEPVVLRSAWVLGFLHLHSKERLIIFSSGHILSESGSCRKYYLQGRLKSSWAADFFLGAPSPRLRSTSKSTSNFILLRSIRRSHHQ